MFFDLEITEDLLNIPSTAPRLTRQYGCSNLLELLSLDNYERSNPVLSINTEITLDEYVFKSMPNFDQLNNSNNLPQLKRYNSEIKQTTKSPNIKRINTF